MLLRQVLLLPLSQLGNNRGFDKIFIDSMLYGEKTEMSNAPEWGVGIYVNPPMMTPQVPGWGVVGRDIDRSEIFLDFKTAGFLQRT